MPIAPEVLAIVQPADSVVTRVVLDRSVLEQMALVGQALASLLVLAMLVAATLTLLSLRRGLDELTRLLRNSSADITAAVRDARAVADELRSMTSRVRGSVETVTRGIAGATSAATALRKRRRRRRGPRGEKGEEGGSDDSGAAGDDD